MNLTIGLLNSFLEEILGFYEYKQITNDKILKLVKLVDAEEQFWHVEDTILWRTRAWRQDESRKERMKALAAQETAIIDLRKDTLKLLTESVTSFFNLQDAPEAAELIAYKMLAKKNIIGAKLVGVDISNVPDAQKPYKILTEKGGMIVL